MIKTVCLTSVVCHSASEFVSSLCCICACWLSCLTFSFYSLFGCATVDKGVMISRSSRIMYLLLFLFTIIAAGVSINFNTHEILCIFFDQGTSTASSDTIDQHLLFLFHHHHCACRAWFNSFLTDCCVFIHSQTYVCKVFVFPLTSFNDCQICVFRLHSPNLAWGYDTWSHLRMNFGNMMFCPFSWDLGLVLPNAFLRIKDDRFHLFVSMPKNACMDLLRLPIYEEWSSIDPVVELMIMKSWNSDL